MGSLPAFLLVVPFWAAPPGGRSDPARIAELIRVVAPASTSDADRRAAENELMRHDPVAAAPQIIAALERTKYKGAGHYYSSDPNPPPEFRAEQAFHRLWQHFAFAELEVVWVPAQPGDTWVFKAPMLKDNRSPETKRAIGAVLAELLTGDRSDATRRMVLGGFRRYYVPAAEAPLAAILAKKSDPDMEIVAEILLEQHPRKYAAAVIDRAADPARPVGVRQMYLSACVGPAPVFDKADRNRLIRAGFAILSETRRVYTAGDLELILRKDFKPNPNLPKYRDKHGLNAAYSADTVTNALVWWAVHKAEYE